jgi:HB1, ASXL, restriction endonuclease HTH domain
VGEARASPAAAAKLPRRRQPKAAADSTSTRLSAVDAAAKVLGETGQALSCPQLIALMAARGYWTSPGGKTPQATLCSALVRDIAAKGPNSRFVKSQRGKFAVLTLRFT